MGKKCRVLVCVNMTIVVFLASFYFTFIRHPPPEEILANQASQLNGSQNFELDPNKAYSMAEIARAAWGKWVQQNKYVSIGDVFDRSCDDESRILVGKVVVLTDEETQGIKVRIYTNTTFDTPILYGKAHIMAYYNGNEFFKKGLDLCSSEANDPDKVFKCPINKGRHFFVKEKKISPFIPKGAYDGKVWIVNQSKKTILCCKFALKL